MCTDHHAGEADIAQAAPRTAFESNLEVIPLDPVESITLTTLVDNTSDALLLDQGVARRAGIASGAVPKVADRFSEWGDTIDGLRAEHGFSMLVTIETRSGTRRLLFDAGMTPDGMIGNMRRLEIPPADVDVIVLSHGHFDHTMGLDGFVEAVGRTSVPMIIHPALWTQRRIAVPGRDPVELPTPSRRAFEGAGFTIVEDQRPSLLLEGAVLITGEVDRTTEFEQGLPFHEARRAGGWEPDQLVVDDQALIVHVRDKGILVLTGCGHAGIVNIVRYAQRLTGIDRVYAVIGGFHLNGPLFEPIIPATCDALAAVAPSVLVPAHCTGLPAVRTFADRLPDAFIQNSVGTRYELAAGAA